MEEEMQKLLEMLRRLDVSKQEAVLVMIKAMAVVAGNKGNMFD